MREENAYLNIVKESLVIMFLVAVLLMMIYAFTQVSITPTSEFQNVDPNCVAVDTNQYEHSEICKTIVDGLTCYTLIPHGGIYCHENGE